MRALRFALNGIARELRAGELLVLLAALSIAVASMTAIGFLTDRISRAVALQATEILAADLRLSSGRPLTTDLLTEARQSNLSTATGINFPSVVFAGDQSTLASLKAVSTGYPLRGELRIADRLFDPARVTDVIPTAGEVYADAALLARLGTDVGAQIDVGSLTLRVAAVLVYRPDQSPGFSGLAPTLLMNIDDIAASGLLVEGSRASYTQLFAGAPEDVDAFADSLRAESPEGVRIEDQAESGSQLASAIDRAGRFLSLASLVSLILAAVAVAMAARRYADRRLDSAALMKTFGASQAFVLQVGLWHLLVVGIVSSLIGVGLGYAAERVLSAALAGWLRGDLPAASWAPVLPGVATALVLLVGFGLPALLRLGETPPMRVLRHDLEPPPPAIWLTYGTALGALAIIVYWAVPELNLLVIILGGTLATTGVLLLGGRVLVGLLGRLRGQVGVSWRYGLANVARRGGDSAVQVVAFGLGLMVLLLLTLVRNDLLDGWNATVPADAPNQFLINIQADERDSIRTLLADAGIDNVDFVPLVRGRINLINGLTPEQWREQSTGSSWRAGRETNLSWSDTLDPSNEITAGEFWSPDHAGPPEVSVDEDIAEEMGLSVGDALTFDIAGQQRVATVSSLRKIDWDSFKPNFFMVLSPDGMTELPQTFITSLYIAQSDTGVLRDLVRAHPSVSVIDIDAALAQVRGIIEKATLAVQYVFLFTLAAGVVVLFAAIQSTLDERRFESALLRTFGASRRVVLTGILAEFSALGLLSGVCAATGATIIGIVVARELFSLPMGINPLLWIAGTVGGLVLVGLSGTLAAQGAAKAPPVTTLRGR
ncbi:MAG: FtsX-like permease family protein [Pseudomonadota bacterium]